MPLLGIIGGSGLNRIAALEDVRREILSTPYGEPSAALTFGRLRGAEVVFLARHGDGHVIAPHRINYRANIRALHDCGARDVVAVTTAGGILEDLKPGALVVPDQIIDYTHGRASTFFDGVDQPLDHVDFTQPFCETMRGRLLRAGADAGEHLRDGGVYGATQGPRLETAAEIRRMARDGAGIVGMTGMPEAALAREMGLCYAMLAVVVNAAAGVGGNRDGIALGEIRAVSGAAMKRVEVILGIMAGGHGG
ncbi:MAG: S-methyl-5'-thioinosine phosphorylase [Burkholderiales bacterium]|nr:S-methyl-5'-thioinosine phosphorylase [Burkholderiales bacterium]